MSAAGRKPAGGRDPLGGRAALREEYKAALDRINLQLDAACRDKRMLESREEEWIQVNDLLRDLPKKVTHPIMVPFGPLAFFPGHLEHTNEVTTQLGSEWFALRTASQAAEMAHRRMKHITEEKEGLTKKIADLRMMGGTAGEEAAEGSVQKATALQAPDGFMDIREPVSAAAAGSREELPAPMDGGKVAVDGEGFLDIREPCDNLGMPLGVAPATPAAPRASSPVRQATSTLDRLRELERMEEEEPEEDENLPAMAAQCCLPEDDFMAELDSIQEVAESWKTAPAAAVPASDAAWSPAAMFRGGGVGIEPKVQAPSAGRSAAAENGASPAAGLGSNRPATWTGSVQERAAGPEAAGALKPETAARPNVASFELPASSAASITGTKAPASDADAPPPKRLSKFKADRQSMQ